MKKTILSIFICVFFFTGHAYAGEYKTWAYGDTGPNSCDKVKKEVWSQAKYQCNNKGGIKVGNAGGCDTEKVREKSYKSWATIVFECNK